MASGIISQPTTFRAPDGHQYVAVLTGLGGRFGVARNGVDKRDATALEGAGNALRDLPRPADESGALYVFKLP
jgi:alcohol dehydrogenase (cytochrome c)